MILQTGLVVIVCLTLFLPPRKFALDGKHALDCALNFFCGSHAIFQTPRILLLNRVGKWKIQYCMLPSVGGYCQTKHSFT